MPVEAVLFLSDLHHGAHTLDFNPKISRQRITELHEKVDLANVDKVAIGVGTRGNTAIAGTVGKMYFDDILLIR